MIIYENVETLTKEEIKAITFKNTSYTASLVSHIVKCAKIAKALTDEVEKHKSIIKAHEQELSGNKLISVEHTEAQTFSKDDFIAVYGEEEYKRFCIMQERRTVKFNG